VIKSWPQLGLDVGDMVGDADGVVEVGEREGALDVGETVGKDELGDVDGVAVVGDKVGEMVGDTDGVVVVGETDGEIVGDVDGLKVGALVGAHVTSQHVALQLFKIMPRANKFAAQHPATVHPPPASVPQLGDKVGLMVGDTVGAVGDRDGGSVAIVGELVGEVVGV